MSIKWMTEDLLIRFSAGRSEEKVEENMDYGGC